MKRINLTGQRFGRLTVIGEGGRTKKKSVLWLCQCDCGKTVRPTTNDLTSGNTKSCGCFGRDQRLKANIKHGRRNSRAYRIWSGMIQRCTNPKHKDWSLYGGRGIAVCDSWMDFSEFYKDMGDPPPGTSIDRISVNGPYHPDNCRWATDHAQSRNTRRNVMLTHNGQTKPLCDWAKEKGLSYITLYNRIHASKWPVGKALETPVRS